MYEIIALMGKRKVNLDRSNAAFTPLYYAVEQGNQKLVASLLTAGANPSARAEGGRLPLKAALANVEILKLLLTAREAPGPPWRCPGSSEVTTILTQRAISGVWRKSGC